LRRKKSATAGDNDGFPIFSPQLRNLLLPDKFKPLGITKYDAKQDPIIDMEVIDPDALP
jgi:hypothetical protein